MTLLWQPLHVDTQTLAFIHSLLYVNVVLPAQAEYSYFSDDFSLKIFLYYYLSYKLYRFLYM